MGSAASASLAFAAPGLAVFKVLLVDDHDLVRVGLRTVLDAEAGLHIQWLEANNLHDAMALYAAEANVALVLLDLNMADCKGLQGLRQFLSTFPDARVMVMSGTQDEFIVGQAMGLGAVGHMSKRHSSARVRASIVSLLTLPLHASVLSRPATAAVHHLPRHLRSPSDERMAELGPRHLEILELVLSGCSNREISHAIGLSLGTVKNYVSTILLAMDVKSRSHLISLFH